MQDENGNALLQNLSRLHTTELGAVRVRKNLGLHTADVVGWCRGAIQATDASIRRSGKNWYVDVEGVTITVNAHSYTVITAHRKR